MAMTWPAPAMRAPWMVDRPTPPQPSTATDSPGCTWATFSTEPTPVITPQPRMQARSSGTVAGSGVSASARTRVYSLKVPRLKARWMAWPRQRVWPSAARGLPSSGFTPMLRSQTLALPRAHCGHWPQGMAQFSSTGLPRLSCVTPSPKASTWPAPSWPITNGPSQLSDWRSVWQRPEAAIFTRTSPGPGAATSVVSMWKPPCPSVRAARAAMEIMRSYSAEAMGSPACR